MGNGYGGVAENIFEGFLKSKERREEPYAAIILYGASKRTLRRVRKGLVEAIAFEDFELPVVARPEGEEIPEDHFYYFVNLNYFLVKGSSKQNT